MSPKYKLIIEVLVIILLIAGCLGYQAITSYASRIFPVNLDEILCVFVDKDYHTEGERRYSSLEGQDLEDFITALNKLEPVRVEKMRERTTSERVNTDYSVTLWYNEKTSIFRRSDIVHLWFRPDGRIIVDNDGYEYYDEHSEYYQEFLSLLHEYEKLCLDENF